MTKAEIRESLISNLHLLKLRELEILTEQVKMKEYRVRPDLWLSERFGEKAETVLWENFNQEAYKLHKWDGDPNPLYQIWKAIAEGNWSALESATGTGKTYILARIVFWFLDCYENSLVVTSAPKREQLVLHLWREIGECFGKFRKIRPWAELTHLKLKVDGRDKESDEDQNSGWQAVGFVAGIRAGEKSATKAQGFHRKDMLIISEETPGMPIATLEAFKNTSVGAHNLILAVGNPDSNVDPLGFFCRIPRVKAFRASALDHPNVVCKKEVIPGAVTQISIDQRRDEYSEDSPFYKSRVRGISPAQGSDSLIHLAWLQNCLVGSIDYEKLGEIPVDPRSHNALGVDVANSELGDKACLAWGKKNQLVQLHEFQCPSASHLAYNLIDSNEKLFEKDVQNYNTSKISDFGISSSCIGVDAVGVGASTVNAFKDRKYQVIAIQGGQVDEQIPLEVNDVDGTKTPMYAFFDLRAQMYYAAREDLQGRKISLKLPPEIYKQLCIELTVITFVRSGGKIRVESKDTIKNKLSGKSPNMADAFVYWNWVRKGVYRRTGAGLDVYNPK